MANLNPDIEAAQIEWRSHGHDGDTKHDVNRALAELPVVSRRIIVLRFFEGMTFGEVGEEMNISADKARRLYHTSALALKKILTRPREFHELTRADLDKRTKK